MHIRRMSSDVATGITDHLPSRGPSSPSPEAGTAAGPIEVVRGFLQIVAAIGQYGVIAATFALPLVVACFGLYFLWIAVSGPEANGAKIGVGIFTIVFGSGLLILLLWIFDRRDLWKKLRPTAQKHKKQKRAAA
jgi:hypothetical protein